MKSVSASIIQGSAIGPALCCKWIWLTPGHQWLPHL